MKKMIWIALAILLPALVVFFGFTARYFDQSMNTVSIAATEIPADAFYHSLPFIADLHCDMLLWNRNFFGLHHYGHVDLPRLQQANVAFLAYTVVSKVPRGINIEENDDHD
jgi:membrane dipeptidase